MSNLEFARAQGRDTKIKFHGPEAFAGMAKAGALVAEALDLLTEMVRPGVTTGSLDRFVFDFAMSHGAIPAPLNYRGFPKSICTSLNHVVCHGIPGPRVLKEGDILNIDVTLILDGWHGDSSRMYAVGKISRAAERLLDVTYNALMRGVAAVRPGATTGDIGAAIALQRGTRFLRPRARPRVPRPAQHSALRRARRGASAQARHVVHHRADDQSRQAACENPVRRLDSGHPRPLAVGAIRACRRRD
jgi:methionine aminopeptidase